MNSRLKLPVSLLLLASPIAAHAEGLPSLGIEALVGGFVGGFGGALLACWLCHRRKSKGDNDPKDR